MRLLLLIPTLLLAAIMTYGQQVNVTLTVDVSNETVDATGVHVAGNWDPDNQWNPAGTPMTDNGDGTWSVTIQADANTTFEYKYLLGNDWALGNEGIPDGSTCIVGGGNTNRILSVGEEDVVVPTVCYNACASCKADGEATVEFSVDMSLAGEIADSIIVTGSFVGWVDSIYMQDNNNDSIYSAAVNLTIGDTIEYKFKNGPDGWESVSGTCTQNGNRFLIVEEDVVLPTVCFERCEPCVLTDSVFVTFAVNMTNEQQLDGVSDLGVHVAGNFQGEAGFGGDWNPGATELTDQDEDGIYEVTVYIPEGDYEYKFLNGNDWGTEEAIPSDCRLEGTSNRGISIAKNGADTVLVGPICFGGCDATCPQLRDPVDVTFRVDMSNEFPSPEGVHVAGDFKNPKWDRDTFQMTETDIPGVYTFTTDIRPGFSYQFKFVNGASEGEEESYAFKDNGCGEDNGFGGSNRTLDLKPTFADTILPVFVYNSCDESTLVNTFDLSSVEDLRAFPNPASTYVTVQFERVSQDELWFELRDFSGRLLRHQNIDMAANSFEIDRRGLASGLYIGVLKNEKGALRSFRFVFN